jgi:hypothetical protein
MLHTHHAVLIQREIQEVFHFVALDFFGNYRKWSPEVSELEQLTPGRMRAGVTGRQVRHDYGYRTESHFKVTCLVPLAEMRFVSLSKPRFEVAYLFEEVGSDTRLTFHFGLELPLFMRPFKHRVADTIEKAGMDVVGTLKRLLETGNPSHGSGP